MTKRLPKSANNAPKRPTQEGLKQDPGCCTPDCCGGSAIDRRHLFKGAVAASMSFLLGERALAVTLKESDATAHYVPADKDLDPQWLKELFSKGERKIYRGREL